MSKGQGKHLKKGTSTKLSSRYVLKSLPWLVIDTNGSKLSFYRNIFRQLSRLYTNYSLLHHQKMTFFNQMLKLKKETSYHFFRNDSQPSTLRPRLLLLQTLAISTIGVGPQET